MLTGTVQNAASPELKRLLRRLNDRLKFFKTWGTAVYEKARANARAKRGRRLWRTIADLTRLVRVSNSGAAVECLSYIGAHKEFGGPIKAKNGRYLTIPIHKLAKGRTVGELEAEGMDIFRLPGTKTLGRGVGKGKHQKYEPLFALCERTRPQRPDPWWVSAEWALEKGVEEAKWHIEKGH